MLWTLLIGGGLLLGDPSSPDDASQRFVEALRSRRLDGILEAFIEQESSRKNNTVTPALAVELAQSLAIRAAESASDAERTSLWKHADEVLTRAIAETTEPILRARLYLEQIELGLGEARWLSDRDELQGHVDGSPSSLDRLAKTFERSTEYLRWLQGRLAELANDPPTSLQKETIAQLRALEPLAFCSRGEVQLATGKAIAPTDTQRGNWLRQGLEDFRAVGPGSGRARGIALRGAAESLRLLGRAKEGIELLQSTSSETFDDSLRTALDVEWVECLLATGDTLKALQIVHSKRNRSVGTGTPPVSMPEWEYLYLKVLLRQAGAMPGDVGSVAKLQASALRQLRLLDATQDRVWVRRAEVLLGQHARQLMLEESTEFRQAGEILTRSGDYRQAAEVYLAAAEKAKAQGETDNVFTLLDESARAWEKAADYARARDTFLRLVETNPESAIAPEAMLHAAINARRAYLADRSPASYAELVRIVREHLARYSHDESAGDVRFLQATMFKAERAYEQAIHEFMAVPADHRLCSSSRLSASRTYETWKRPLDPTAPPDGSLGKVVAFHESLLSQFPAAAGDPRAELITRLSSFLLDRRIDRPQDARARLEALLAEPQISHQWIQLSRRLLILALVRLQEFDDAERWADLHARSGLPEIKETLELLHREAEAISELERKFVGRVQAHLVAGIREEVAALPPADRVDWTLLLARVELHLGNDAQLSQAIDQLEDLRREHPRDARITELVGLCYLKAQRYDSAVPIFRSLVSGLPENSNGWYRAKLSLIVALRRAGQVDQARKLLESLEILHPELGGGSLREQFRQERETLFPAS